MIFWASDVSLPGKKKTGKFLVGRKVTQERGLIIVENSIKKSGSGYKEKENRWKVLVGIEESGEKFWSGAEKLGKNIFCHHPEICFPR